MKALTASLVIGLLVAGTSPAAPVEPVVPLDGPVQLVAVDTTTARDTYAHEARAKMLEWKTKLHDFGKTADAKGTQAGATVQSDLNIAWAKADAASRKLQAAGADGWENAKASYETAGNNLAETWKKISESSK